MGLVTGAKYLILKFLATIWINLFPRNATSELVTDSIVPNSPKNKHLPLYPNKISTCSFALTLSTHSTILLIFVPLSSNSKTSTYSCPQFPTPCFESAVLLASTTTLFRCGDSVTSVVETLKFQILGMVAAKNVE
jgi:hypothetical protein